MLINPDFPWTFHEQCWRDRPQTFCQSGVYFRGRVGGKIIGGSSVRRTKVSPHNFWPLCSRWSWHWQALFRAHVYCLTVKKSWEKCLSLNLCKCNHLRLVAKLDVKARNVLVKGLSLSLHDLQEVNYDENEPETFRHATLKIKFLKNIFRTAESSW